jgi:hypothetical protein
MCTDAEAVSDFVRATHSASSFNTAADRFPERDPGTATHSASSSDAAADAYRFAASYSGAAPVSRRVEGNHGAHNQATFGEATRYFPDFPAGKVAQQSLDKNASWSPTLPSPFPSSPAGPAFWDHI